jgi:hypothetical protein
VGLFDAAPALEDVVGAKLVHTDGRSRRERPKGGFLAIISGPDLRVAFPTLDQADLFVQTIDLAMVNSRVVRRDIPILMPGLYEEILRTSGRPVEPGHVIAVARAAADMIAAHAQIFFTSTGDRAAVDRFARDFGDRRGTTTADDMIDWLWDWDPRCHQPLRGAVGTLHARLIDRHH